MDACEATTAFTSHACSTRGLLSIRRLSSEAHHSQASIRSHFVDADVQIPDVLSQQVPLLLGLRLASGQVIEGLVMHQPNL